MNNYSFIYHPVVKLHDIIPDILPGIEKMITVHYDGSENIIRGFLTEKGGKEHTTIPLNLDKILTTLQRYMEEKNPYDWYNRQNLPFEIEKSRSIPTMNIFSELQNIVLLIRVPDMKQELNDLIFLYLNENPSNFGVTNSINPLTTDNKSIIAFVLNNTIRTFMNLQYSDKEVLKSFNLRTRQIIGQTQSLKDEMDRTKENYGISLIKLCQQIVKDLGSKDHLNYFLSKGAVEKLKSYKGEIKDLENVIKEASSYASSLVLDEDQDIEITEWHILFDLTKPIEKTTQSEVQKTDVYSKTISLLDKLENAALVVKSNQLKLTGTNVGNACPVSISAPAISDALYNHKSKINSLLKKHPDKWETIRSDFRPLKNVMNDQDSEN
jgi:hypothetical protein